jgi:hypothetical protein
VQRGQTYTWEVRADDLAVGDRVDLGWSTTLADQGRCVYRQLVGTWLCLDLVNPARYLTTAVAVADPANPGEAVAELTIRVPNTPRDWLYLQALRVDGRNSATSVPLLVQVDAPPCPAAPTDTVDIATQADVFAHANCVVLRRLNIAGSGPNAPVDATFPALEEITTQLDVRSSPLLRQLSFPALVDMSSAIEITDNPLLERLLLPVLDTGSGGFELEFNDVLERVEMPLLHGQNYSSMTLNSNPALRELDLSGMTTGAPRIRIMAHDTLERLDLSNLQDADSLYLDVLPALDTVDLPATPFRFDNDLWFDNTTALTDVDLTGLTDVGRQMRVENSGFTTLQFPNARDFDELWLFSNSSLSSVELGHVDTIDSLRVWNNSGPTSLTMSPTAWVSTRLEIASNANLCLDPTFDFSAIAPPSALAISGNACN